MFVGCPKEAVQRCGSQAALEKAIEGKRVFKANVQGMVLYFFPRREFSRDQVFCQALDGSVDKGGDMEQFQAMNDDQMGFEWEPQKLINNSGLLNNSSLTSSLRGLMGSSTSTQPSLVDALSASGVVCVYVLLARVMNRGLCLEDNL